MAEEEYVESWADLKVAELREELEARNLPTSGTKAEMVTRLEEDDAQRDAEAESEEQSPEPNEEPTPPEVSAGSSGAPIEAESDQESDAETGEKVPAIYVAEIELPDDVDNHFDLEDEDLTRMRLEARQKAVDAGLTPLGDAHSARFAFVNGRNVTFEVPLR